MPRINHSRRNLSYGVGNPLQVGAPLPIIANRDPGTADIAELGTTWINPGSASVFTLAAVAGNSATWVASAGSGVGVFTDVTITGGIGLDVLTIDDGNIVVSNGDVTLSGLLTAGTATITGLTTINGNLDVTGDVTITGDIDITDTGSIGLTSTNNAAGAITLTANGGTSETILITSLQGTSASSLNLVSAAGGLTATIAGLVSLNSARNNAQAILLNASAGGIDILAAGSAGEDIDIVNTGGSVNITATEDVAQAVYIRANGGTSETVQIHADQGTAANSVNILSDVGGVTMSGGLATADAINIVASNAAGGIDVDAGTGGFALDTTGAFSIDGAAASNVTVTGAGIDLAMSSVGGSVLVSSTENAALSIRLHADGGTSETIQLHSDQGTGVGSINLLSDVGGITLTSTGLASADAINLEAVAGGIDVDAALQINIASSQNAANAIVMIASAGGIDITATGTAGEDLDLLASGSSVNITATENAAQAIYIRANGGTSETVDIHADQGTGAASINVHSDDGGVTIAAGLASADAINISASNAAGGIDVDSGTAGFIVDTTGAVSLDAAAASNFTVTGAGIDLTLSSAGGSVLVESTENAALAIRLHANGGTSETIQLHSDQGTGVGSINLLSDVGGITLTSTGLASADAINLEAVAGGIDMDAALQINIASSQNAASAIVMTSSAGGIDILATGASAGEDIDIVATGSSVNITATEATADAIVLNASNAAGGIDLLTGGGEISISASGNVAMVPGTASVAGTSLTLNARVGVATFTGLTTAAAATETLTITNSSLGAGDGIYCTVSNMGTNDAQMTLTRVNTQTAGTLVVQARNNGAAALNGNLVVTFWIIN